VTAPLPRPRAPGYSQLAIWVRKAIKADLVRATDAEARTQRDIVEEALSDYFRKRPLPAKPPAP